MAEITRMLVIGGTGFIGHHLLNVAVDKKWIVSSLSLHPPKSQRFVKGVEYLQVDMLKQAELEEFFHEREFEYVVNLGGYINHTLFRLGGRQVIEEHFTAIQNLIAFISRKSLRTFIQVGSSDEYGDSPAPQNENLREAPISPYSLGKVATTHFLQMLYKTESFPVVIIRLFLTFGPGQEKKRFLPQIIKGCLNDRGFPTTAGEQLRDFCYVEDVVNAILLALQNEKVIGEVLNIASGQPVSIRNMIKTVQSLIGKGAPCFGDIPYRPGENMCLYADIQKAQEMLQWTPKNTLESGLQKTISWYSEHGLKTFR